MCYWFLHGLGLLFQPRKRSHQTHTGKPHSQKNSQERQTHFSCVTKRFSLSLPLRSLAPERGLFFFPGMATTFLILDIHLRSSPKRPLSQTEVLSQFSLLRESVCCCSSGRCYVLNSRIPSPVGQRSKSVRIGVCFPELSPGLSRQLVRLLVR